MFKWRNGRILGNEILIQYIPIHRERKESEKVTMA